MDTPIGIVIALVALLGAAMLDGTSPMAFVNAPALTIIFGGTFGATIASYSLHEFLALPGLLVLSSRPRPSGGADMRGLLVQFAERARREGLLALENSADQVADPFVRRGLQMVIDGLEPDTVEEVLELELEAMQRRHQKGIAMFQSMGGYAPTMGIIGTVMGLVSVLSRLSDPSQLGASIAVAFIATLIGIASANILWLPIASNLRQKDTAEVAERRMALVGIMAIQAGENPRIVAQKLASFGTPAAPTKPAGTGAPAAAAVVEQAA